MDKPPNWARTVYIDVKRPSFRQQLIYGGKAGSVLKFAYREFSSDMARPAFSQDLSYDLAESNIVGFRSVRMEVIEATNSSITYRVTSGFQVGNLSGNPRGRMDLRLKVFCCCLIAVVVQGCAPPAAAPTTIAASPSISADTAARNLYDIEERCGRTAREWFKQAWGDGHSNSSGVDSYSGVENHYNSRLHKCFMLVTTTMYSKDSKTGKSSSSESKSLADVNDTRELGTYFKSLTTQNLSECTMSGKRCASTDEWDSWSSQLMER